MLSKAPGDVLDFAWDWSQWLDTPDTIVSATWTVSSGIEIATLDEPANLAVSTTTTGGSNAFASSATWYWSVTALNAVGETTAPTPVSATVPADGTATITWSSVPNATGYNIYRGTSPTTLDTLAGTITAPTTTFTDVGATGTSQSPPTVNGADNTTNTTTSATVWLASGTAGDTYPVTCQIVTAAGRIAQWSQDLAVVDL